MKTQRFVRIVLMMLMVSVCGVSEGAETIDRAMAQYQAFIQPQTISHAVLGQLGYRF